MDRKRRGTMTAGERPRPLDEARLREAIDAVRKDRGGVRREICPHGCYIEPGTLVVFRGCPFHSYHEVRRG